MKEKKEEKNKEQDGRESKRKQTIRNIRELSMNNIIGKGKKKRKLDNKNEMNVYARIQEIKSKENRKEGSKIKRKTFSKKEEKWNKMRKKV